MGRNPALLPLVALSFDWTVDAFFILGALCNSTQCWVFYLRAPISMEIIFFFLWRCDPMRVMASLFLRFLDHTQRRTTVGRTPLDEWSARRKDLYLTTHNTHNRQTSMPPVGFEPTISAGERPKTYALDRTTTGTFRWRQGAEIKTTGHIEGWIIIQ
jgi:hypothetical protein